MNQQVDEMGALLISDALLFEAFEHVVERIDNPVDVGLPDRPQACVPVLGFQKVEAVGKGIYRSHQPAVKEYQENDVQQRQTLDDVKHRGARVDAETEQDAPHRQLQHGHHHKQEFQLHDFRLNFSRRR